MSSSTLENIVIVGGGTAGWMTAAALSRLLPQRCRIRLVESEAIGTVGVGEATIPHIRYFNSLLGIDEAEFMRATGATYKLAIRFVGWGSEQGDYFHPFSAFGSDLNGLDFHHYWLKVRSQLPELSLDDFSAASLAAATGRFAQPPADAEHGFGYAFHLDASRYARYLRDFAEQRGVQRIEGKVESVECDPDSGHIRKLAVDSGQLLEGQLFVDCSGFRGLLIEKALGVGYQSWRHWLPCDRAVAMASPGMAQPPSYTKVTATQAGWIWQIPLQHRTGNGHVYASDYLSDDEACARLLQQIDGQAESEPNFIRFEPGYRHRSWEKNCVAIGLSGGFLEPLESTSIYLIQMAILKLVEFFPDAGCTGLGRDAYNRWMALEYERVRDFLVLHYHLNQRQDSPFWRDRQSQEIPPELGRKMALFRQSAAVEFYEHGLFAQPSWLAVYLGQGLSPDRLDPRVESLKTERVAKCLRKYAEECRVLAQSMPEHAEALAQNDTGPRAAANLSLYGGRYG